MQKAVMLAAVVALLACKPNSAHAYDGPWCAVISLGGGFVSERCSMPSFEVCRQEALRFGPTSFCRQNGFPGLCGRAPAVSEEEIQAQTPSPVSRYRAKPVNVELFRRPARPIVKRACHRMCREAERPGEN